MKEWPHTQTGIWLRLKSVYTETSDGFIIYEHPWTF